MKTNSKVAIIGLGNIGKVVATNLAHSNTNFIAADRSIAKANELAEKLGATVQPGEISSAVKQADILILSIPFGEIGKFLHEHAADLEGKIIVDPSNPIAPDENGGFKKIIAAEKSAGEINAEFLPKDAKLAKALGTLGAGSLGAVAHQKPEAAALFYATDDQSIDPQIEELIINTGFEPVRVGNLNQSIRIEVFGDLHEFGALGKTVTKTEAQSKI